MPLYFLFCPLVVFNIIYTSLSFLLLSPLPAELFCFSCFLSTFLILLLLSTQRPLLTVVFFNIFSHTLLKPLSQYLSNSYLCSFQLVLNAAVMLYCYYYCLIFFRSLIDWLPHSKLLAVI